MTLLKIGLLYLASIMIVIPFLLGLFVISEDPKDRELKGAFPYKVFRRMLYIGFCLLSLFILI